jgi:hypothetical protein
MNIKTILSMSNKEFASQVKRFNAACVKAGIIPTKRQAAKWRNRKGVAFFTVKGI